eukprot:TRINITY_DN42546_c0_g1_i1.p1 TRINITY_DN42546_c0_g1~~TRINITY_DN42546_c0_g1_i1.p1  ORF type:complete len:587 (-),score=79.09 TRINITY_DN42546_c0_g1_i1:56-1783(-)
MATSPAASGRTFGRCVSAASRPVQIRRKAAVSQETCVPFALTPPGILRLHPSHVQTQSLPSDANAVNETHLTARTPKTNAKSGPIDMGSFFGPVVAPPVVKDLGAVGVADSGRFYQRSLPASQVPFSSPEGRRLFKEALTAGSMENFFHLAEQFRTQDEPTFCGLTTLTMVLNSLRIDPMRTWKGAWRWYSESMLSCCFGADRVRAEGMSFDMFRSLARCQGAVVVDRRAPGATDSLEAREEFTHSFREAVRTLSRSCRREAIVICYSREPLGQSGAGHFSPVGGYHEATDSLLILDVARFKYPPHWAPLSLVADAMTRIDPDTDKPRGYLHLTLQEQATFGDEKHLQTPLRLPYMPPAAGKRLSMALSEHLAAQCSNHASSWESWSVIAMRRWLHAAAATEPQVLRQLLQVGDVSALREVCDRLQSLPLYMELRDAYAQLVDGAGDPTFDTLPAEFPPLRFGVGAYSLNKLGSNGDDLTRISGASVGSDRSFDADPSLETCGELWVLLLLLLPEHLRRAASEELAGLSIARAVTSKIKGPWALPTESLRQTLSQILLPPDAKQCAISQLSDTAE